jgi:hypothetical protein
MSFKIPIILHAYLCNIRSADAPAEGTGNIAPVLGVLFYLGQLQACQNLAQGTQKKTFFKMYANMFLRCLETLSKK